MRPISSKIGYPDEKPNINSVEVHPQCNNNRHPLDGVPVVAGSLSITFVLSSYAHTHLTTLLTECTAM
jgi:hypothetical protein